MTAHLRVSRWNPSFFSIKLFGGSCFFFYLGWNPIFFDYPSSSHMKKTIEDPCSFWLFGGTFFLWREKWGPSFDWKLRSFRQIWRQLIFDRRLLFGSCWITKESWIWIIFWSCVSESYSYMMLVSDIVKNTTYIHAYIIYICTYTNCIQSL